MIQLGCMNWFDQFINELSKTVIMLRHIILNFTFDYNSFEMIVYYHQITARLYVALNVTSRGIRIRPTARKRTHTLLLTGRLSNENVADVLHTNLPICYIPFSYGAIILNKFS